LATAHSKYYGLGIIGSQSSGKSTLLNSLFDTTFQMMNQEENFQQTTVGIWMAILQNQNVLVFDVEGSDSGERADAGQVSTV